MRTISQTTIRPCQTFRDTTSCREMVLDYTCLWWGSTNLMYDNRCGVEAQVMEATPRTAGVVGEVPVGTISRKGGFGEHVKA